MTFELFCLYLDDIGRESGRDDKAHKIAVLINHLSENRPDVKIGTYILNSSIAPKYAMLEPSFASKSMIKAIRYETRIDLSDVLKDLGDTGDMMGELVDRQSSLTLEDVYKLLLKMAEVSKTNEKEKIYLSLFRKCSNLEMKYINRLLSGNIRIGVSDKTILDALAFFHNMREFRDILALGRLQ